MVQPVNQQVVSGGSVAFTLTATSTSPLDYRWQVSDDAGAHWNDVQGDAVYHGANTATLTLIAVPLTLHNRHYRTQVMDSGGTTTSVAATLTVEHTELWGVGASASGQLGLGVSGYVTTPVLVQSGMQVMAARNSYSSLFLKTDGTLWAAGLNTGGQLHDGTYRSRAAPVRIATQVKAVSSSSQHTLFVKFDNTLWVVGINNNGQLGTGDKVDRATPVQIDTDVVSIAAGSTYSLYVKSDGTLLGMGYGNEGQIGQRGLIGQNSISPAQIDTGVAKVYTGIVHSFYIKTNGTLWGMGRNSSGQLGLAGISNRNIAEQIDTGVTAAAAGRDHSAYLKSDGSLWAMGLNSDGRLGDGTLVNRAMPVQIATGILAVAADTNDTFYIKTDGSLWGAGRNGSGQLGDGTRTARATPIQIADGVIAASASSSHLLFLKANGDVWAAGWNEFGEFGNGQVTYASKPVWIADGVVDYSAGNSHSLFVKSDATLWGMGGNQNGELGDGSMVSRNNPTLLINGVMLAYAGSTFSLILKQDGSLWGMGRSDLGQIGLGPTSPYLVPQTVDTGVKSLIKGVNSVHSLYLKTDGTLWGMGINASGQLGGGTAGTQKNTPVKVAEATIKAASAGSSHSLYLAADGQLWGLGANFYGNLGNGTTANTATPVPVNVRPAGSIVEFSAGAFHTLLRDDDGVVWGVGGNSSGELGQGTISVREIEAKRMADHVAALSAGYSQSYFVKTNGTLWGMGVDNYATFSPDSTLAVTTPAQIATGVTSVSAGLYHALFLKRGALAPPVIQRQPEGMDAVYGERIELTIEATGFPTPKYQWRKNGEPIVGAADATYVIPWAVTTDGGEYDVVVSSSLGMLISDIAAVTVAAAVAPSISSQPASIVYQIPSGSVTLQTKVSGTPPLTLQWRKNGISLPDKIDENLTLQNLRKEDAGSYTLRVTSPHGEAVSEPAVLQVEDLPRVLTASAQRFAPALGESVTLSITAESAYAPLTYQWKQNNRPISGATGASYTIPAVARRDAGAYTVEITDAHGFVSRWTGFVLPRYEQTQVIVWGDYTNLSPNSSIDIPNALAVASVGSRAYILRNDGTVLARDAKTGETTLIDGLTDIVALSGGSFLRANGTVAQILQNNESYALTELGVDQAVGISTYLGTNLTVVLKADGTVQAFGVALVIPEDLRGVTAIAAGSYSALALKIDGTVTAFKKEGVTISPVPADLHDVVAIATTGPTNAAVRSDGSVAAWGSGAGSVSAPSGMTEVAQVSLSYDYVYVIRTNGAVEAVVMAAGAGIGPIPANVAPAVALDARFKPVIVIRDSSGDAAPLIATPPAAQTVDTHGDATFSVVATGVGPLYYQWRKDGVDLPGQVAATLTLTDISLDDAGYYAVEVSSHAGSIVSTPAKLTVIPLPEVTLGSPRRQVLAPGAPLSLAVDATGAGILRYQWYRNSQIVPGATSNQFQRGTVTVADAGYYWVTVTDDIGVRRSATMFVRVAPEFTQVRGWGRSLDGGQLNIPTNLWDAVDLAAGYGSAIALRRDGTVVTWSYNAPFSQPSGWNDIVEVAACDNGKFLGLRADGTVVGHGFGPGALPTGLTQIVAVRARSSTMAALRADGTMVVWTPPDVKEIDPAWGRMVDISSGHNRFYALRDDGTMLIWPNLSSPEYFSPVELTDVVQVADEYVRKSNGTWGRVDPYSGTFNLDAGMTNARDVSSSYFHVVVLHADGHVTASGDNSQGQATVPADLGPAIAVASASGYSLALVDYTTATVPEFVQQPTGLTVLETQPATISVVAAGGTPLRYQWRKGGQPIAGATTAKLTITETKATDTGTYDVVVTNDLGVRTSDAVTLTVKPIPVVTLITQSRWVSAPGDALHFAATATGTGALSYQWYHNGRAINGATAPAYDIGTATMTNDGYYFLTVTDQNGTRRSKPIFVTVMPVATEVIGWGYDYNGQASGAPTGGAGYISLSNAGHYVLGLRRDGTVTAWGDFFGPPTVPFGLKDVVAIAAGETRALALKADGSVVMWTGSGYSLNIFENMDIVSIAPADSGAYGVKSDGSVVTWGLTGNAVPAGLPPVAKINARGAAMAMLTDGRVAAWNITYYPGDTDYSYAEFPYPPNFTDVVDVEYSPNKMVALREDGTLRKWGGAEYFTYPDGLSDLKALALGQRYGVALKSDGSVVGWGTNAYGLLPNVGGRLLTIVAEGWTTLALRDATSPTIPYISRQPRATEVYANQPFTLEVRAVATPAPTYQWRKNGEPILNATAAVYSVNAATPATIGNYDVVVTNTAGSTYSAAAAVKFPKKSQYFTYFGLDNLFYSDSVIILSATTTADLPMAFSVLSGPAKITGNQLTMTGVGSVTLRLTQDGNDDYAAMTPVEYSFVILDSCQSWLMGLFTTVEWADPAVSGISADPDKDGLANLMEYALGLGPKTADTAGLPEVGTTATEWVYTYTRPPERADISYTVEVSTDLISWSTSNVTHAQVSAANGMQTWQATYPLGSATNLFFRLKVQEN